MKNLSGGKLKLQSVTLISSKSGIDTRTLAFFRAQELTLLSVLQLYPVKGLMSWLKYYSLEIPMKASVLF